LLADGPRLRRHLVADTGAKQPMVSHHLRALREAGLVVAEPHGRFTYCRLLADALDAPAGANHTVALPVGQALCPVRRWSNNST
jgi:ArsR family transcriptional regulator